MRLHSARLQDGGHLAGTKGPPFRTRGARRETAQASGIALAFAFLEPPKTAKRETRLESASRPLGSGHGKTPHPTKSLAVTVAMAFEATL